MTPLKLWSPSVVLIYLLLVSLVLRTGLEPVSSRVKGGCPNQLDERSKIIVVAGGGIEPPHI